MELWNGLQLIIQHRDRTGAPCCRGFRGLPTTEAGYIWILGCDPRQEEQLANDLVASVMATSPFAIEELSHHMPCGGGQIGGCPALEVPDCHKTLVVLTDGAALGTPRLPGLGTLGRPLVTVPVVPGTVPRVGLPAPLQNLNAIPWTPGDGTVANLLLRTVGITSHSARLFISYVRADADALADQLFDKLHREGFDVFLDRFRVEPGADLHVKLAEQLADKAVVLVLESPKTGSSKWVQHELAFARANRIGVVALQLPGGKRVRGIPPEWRRVIQRNALRRGRLTLSVLDDVMQFIRATHLAAESWRRQRLRDDMTDALALEGFTHQALTTTDVVLATHPSNGRRYAFRMACYPPMLEDFRIVGERPRMSQRAFVVGPAKYMDYRRRSQNEWLASESEIDLYDESEIIELARSLR